MANEVIVAEEGNWLAIRGEGGAVPLPFRQKIFLWRGSIASSSAMKEARKGLLKVRKGTSLVLRREKNPFFPDESAILVLTEKGEEIGFVPHRVSPILARLMDAGKRLVAEFKRTDRIAEAWLDVVVSISMEEI